MERTEIDGFLSGGKADPLIDKGDDPHRNGEGDHRTQQAHQADAAGAQHGDLGIGGQAAERHDDRHELRHRQGDGQVRRQEVEEKQEDAPEGHPFLHHQVGELKELRQAEHNCKHGHVGHEEQGNFPKKVAIDDLEHGELSIVEKE